MLVDKPEFQLILNVLDGNEVKAPANPVKFVNSKLRKLLLYRASFV